MGLFTERLRQAWNVFKNGEDIKVGYDDYGPSFSYQPFRRRSWSGNDRSIVNAILNRMAVDAASIKIEHCQLDESQRYLEPIDSGLNFCLNTEANIDQSGSAFKIDLFYSLLDEGEIAIVPIDFDTSPTTGSFKIQTMRVGKIIEWFPQHVRVRLYDERDGQFKELKLPKRLVAIVENPFYMVMNEPNSILKRLIRKLNLLDAVDEQIGSGKLDLIIQLPYVIKSPTRKNQAEERRKKIEEQLSGSKYGIAYTDGTEKITQLNRPVENNMMKQIEYLTSMLYSQLGLTEEIMNGTASEEVMNNYFSRTIEPIVSAPVDEMIRKFLTQNARSRGQSIQFFRDPFSLIPTNLIAELADKLTRNEIATKNEIRQAIGMRPSTDPKADELRNANISQPKDEEQRTYELAGADKKVTEIGGKDESD